MKKLLSILLALIFCLGMFVSCNNDKHDSSKDDESSLKYYQASSDFEYTGHDMPSKNNNNATDLSFGSYYKIIDTYDDFKDFSKFTECAMKICVQTDDVQKAKLISQSVPACDYLPFSDIPWYKFSSGNATKEFAIKFLSKHLNIPLEEIICFGDDFNDIGMLKLCGKGIAVSNAILEVKNIADEVTLSNNEDGVAKYIEKNLF